uniref:Solute carrier family 2, facilitated glucose transporter member 5 n=1 Tax=Podarcis muralis TaxID=64176 RepID=A0A670KDA4_PODMU|nr:solute carrier family 2, facilitated glucose transporter member 5-like isoform X1 [Podarcis muralis]XP_028572107.1 solute carrier family 2, facilitated glucose transporter member 5-like isoform X1 [Podarcis muralis]
MKTTGRSIDSKAVPEPKPIVHKWEVTNSLLRTVLVTSLGSIQYGYILWVVYSPVLLMEDMGNAAKTPGEQQYLSFMLGLAISLFPIGGLTGALIAGVMVDEYGRKGALLINCFSSMVSSMLMVCATVVQAFLFTMLSRFIVGITIGIFSIVVPLYLIEISPLNMRGAIGMLPHFFLAVGVLLAQTLSFPEMLGNEEDWPILTSVPGILALFQTVVVPSFPESPRYLLIQKNDEEKARLALQKLRHNEDVQEEIEELQQEKMAEKTEKSMNSLKLLCFPSLRWQVISVIILMGGQQLSGVNAVYFYTERLYLSTGTDLNNLPYIRLASSVAIIISVFVGIVYIDSMGRKFLLLLGFGMCTILCVVLTMNLELQGDALWMSYVDALLINIFLMVHAVGPSALPNLIIAELFLQSSRSSAYVVGGFVHWFLNFFSIVTFLNIQKYIGFFSFLICCPICAATFFFILKMVPETTHQTFLEIRKQLPIYVAQRQITKMERMPRRNTRRALGEGQNPV